MEIDPRHARILAAREGCVAVAIEARLSPNVAEELVNAMAMGLVFDDETPLICAYRAVAHRVRNGWLVIDPDDAALLCVNLARAWERADER